MVFPVHQVIKRHLSCLPTMLKANEQPVEDSFIRQWPHPEDPRGSRTAFRDVLSRCSLIARKSLPDYRGHRTTGSQSVLQHIIRLGETPATAAASFCIAISGEVALRDGDSRHV